MMRNSSKRPHFSKRICLSAIGVLLGSSGCKPVHEPQAPIPAPELAESVRQAAERNLAAPTIAPAQIEVMVHPGGIEPKLKTLESLAIALGGSTHRLPEEEPGARRLLARVPASGMQAFKNGALGLDVGPLSGANAQISEMDYVEVTVREKNPE